MQLFQCVAFGDSFRTERDIDTATSCREVLADIRRRARVDGAAQDDKRAIAKMRRDLVDSPFEDRHRRTEELINRGPDDDDQLARPLDDRTVGAEFDPSRRERATKEFVRARLEERHLAARDAIECRLVRVVDADAQASIRESQAQGKTDMATSSEDDNVEFVADHRWHSSSAVPTVTAPIVLGRRGMSERYVDRGKLANPVSEVGRSVTCSRTLQIGQVDLRVDRMLQLRQTLTRDATRNRSTVA